MSQEADAFFEHHGVKGMHWGTRKRSTASIDLINDSSGKRVTVHYDPKKVKRKVDANGRVGLEGSKRGIRDVQKQIDKAHPTPKHDDAIRAQEAKNKVALKGTSSLSNKELQDLITRQNLEQQYSRLNPSVISSGRKVASDVLGNVGKELAKDYAKKAAKSAIKGIAKSVVK